MRLTHPFSMMPFGLDKSHINFHFLQQATAGVVCINWRCLQQSCIAGTDREGNWMWEKKRC